MTEYHRKTVDFEAVFEGTNHREAWTPETIYIAGGQTRSSGVHETQWGKIEFKGQKSRDLGGKSLKVDP